MYTQTRQISTCTVDSIDHVKTHETLQISAITENYHRKMLRVLLLLLLTNKHKVVNTVRFKNNHDNFQMYAYCILDLITHKS